MQLSIVTSMYRSEPYLEQFVERMESTARQLTDEYELILVNDGCPGNSLELAKALLETRPNLRLIELSRNFGHHTAFYAGLEAATGTHIFLIDCDLEESPEWLADFHQVMTESGSDLVYGVQERRQSGFKQGVSSMFYRVFNALSETNIPRDVCTVRLMNRGYQQAIVSMREKNLFLAGLYAWAGFRQQAVPVTKQLRKTRSTYSPARMFKLLVDAITSFSPFPLYLSFFTGLLISGLAGLYGLSLVIRKILEPETIVTGYASLMTTVFFVGGLIILIMGIIGIYLSRMFVEVKNRPHYFIRNTFGYRNDSTADT